MATDRDDILGAALRQLPVPPHRPGFPDQMWALVDVTVASPMGRGRGLRRRRRVLASLAAAAVAAAVTVWFVLSGVPGLKESLPETATARQVAASMSTSLRSLHALRGSVISDWGEGRSVSTFVVDAAGDYRADGTETHRDNVGHPYRGTTIYNASEHVRLNYGWDTGATSVRVTGMRSTPTSNELGSIGDMPFESMAGVVRAALAEGDPDIEITETVFQGRAAWRASFAEGSFSHTLGAVDVIVDRSTGVVLRYRHRAEPHRQPGWTCTVTRLEVEPALPSGLFVTAPPRGARIIDATDDAFCSLREAEARAGYVPLVAGTSPGSFELTGTATFGRASSDRAFFSGRVPDVAGPGSATEVMLEYRLGLDSYVIRQAPISERDRKALRTQDRHVASLSTYRGEVLESGALAGSLAQSWFTSDGAFLQVHSASRCLRISGDLTRQEMVAIAASLRPAHD